MLTRRQQAETDVQEVPPEHQEEQHFCASDRSRLPREAVEPPSPEIFENYLDTNLSNVLWDDPAGAGRLEQMTHRGLFQPDPFCGMSHLNSKNPAPELSNSARLHFSHLDLARDENIKTYFLPLTRDTPGIAVQGMLYGRSYGCLWRTERCIQEKQTKTANQVCWIDEPQMGKQ